MFWLQLTIINDENFVYLPLTIIDDGNLVLVASNQYKWPEFLLVTKILG